MAIGSDVNPVVVGQKQEEIKALDLLWWGAESIAVLGTFEIVDQHDDFVSVGREETLTTKATLHRRAVVQNIAFTNLTTVAYPLTVNGSNDHLLLKEGRAGAIVLR